MAVLEIAIRINSIVSVETHRRLWYESDHPRKPLRIILSKLCLRITEPSWQEIDKHVLFPFFFLFEKNK